MRAPIFSAAQILEIEQLAEQKLAINSTMLMRRAAIAALHCLIKNWPHAQKILIICGAGNNGGDGYVLAYLAQAQGLDVQVLQVDAPAHSKPAAYAAWQTCKENHVPMKKFAEKEALVADVIVDALYGIGLQGAVRANGLKVIQKINQSPLPVLALDIPSGVNADTGLVPDEAVNATATITFIGLKLGLLTGHGASYTGKLFCDKLALPENIFSTIQPIVETETLATWKPYLSPRRRDWHKGRSGHLLVVGGGPGFQGAILLAAEAALRTGAGLVSIATHPEHAAYLNVNRPEVMVHGVADATSLTKLLTAADGVVVGPGLGQDAWAKSLWEAVLQTDLPLVVDADALNLLANYPCVRKNWILTPHPGEAARLLQQSTATVQSDRLAALKNLHNRYGGSCVLKGAGSLIALADRIVLCDKGNPGMATAGMGDVLSGVIGSFLVQGVPLTTVAALGVYLHAIAGDLAAEQGERGLIATDLLPYLRLLSNNPSHE